MRLPVYILADVIPKIVYSKNYTELTNVSCLDV